MVIMHVFCYLHIILFYSVAVVTVLHVNNSATSTCHVATTNVPHFVTQVNLSFFIPHSL